MSFIALKSLDRKRPITEVELTSLKKTRMHQSRFWDLMLAIGLGWSRTLKTAD